MNKALKIVFKVVLSIIVLTVITFIILKLSKTNSNKRIESQKSNKESAQSLSIKYNDIYYGKESNLKDNIINEGGIYNLTGNYNCIEIKSRANVKLNLKNAKITCKNGPAIYSKNTPVININVVGENEITAITNATHDAAIYSKNDLVFTGEGTINIDSNYDGIASKDKLILENGVYNLKTNSDGIKGKDVVAILNGTYNINSIGDGIKSTNTSNLAKGYVTIDNGEFKIVSGHDGIQAETDVVINGGTYNIETKDAKTESSKGIKAEKLIEINDGNININSFDDSIHSNENITINNGNISITSKNDGIYNKRFIEINDGSIKINSKEGIDATNLRINNGNISVTSEKNGINISRKTPDIEMITEINGGTIKIISNRGIGITYKGNMHINDGNLEINAMSTMLYVNDPIYKKGTVILNGEQEDFVSHRTTTSPTPATN